MGYSGVIQFPNFGGNQKIQNVVPGKPSALFFKAIVASFRGKVAFKIGHLAFQVVVFMDFPL